MDLKKSTKKYLTYIEKKKTNYPIIYNTTLNTIYKKKHTYETTKEIRKTIQKMLCKCMYVCKKCVDLSMSL